MIEAQGASEILSANKKKNLAINTQADAPIRFSQLSKTNDLASAGDIFELKVAFVQKVLMHLSFPQTDKPHYFPKFEF